MRGVSILFLITIIFNVSCSNIQKNEKNILITDKKQVIFFTAETNLKEDAAYYDAVLELKNKFPDTMKEMEVLNRNEDKIYYDRFQIEICPAIIVIYNNKILIKMNGSESTYKIVQSISDVLVN